MSSDVQITFRSMMEPPEWKALGRKCRVSPSYDKAFRSIKAELRHLAATDVVVEAGFDAADIRRDGMPRASITPTHQVVRVTFKGRRGVQLAFTCGAYDLWYYNLYLIALTLSSLRSVDRYACTQSDEQYRGWSALPPGRASIAVAEWASVQDAMGFLSSVGKAPVTSGVAAVYRAAAKVAHPDVSGCDALMSKVNRAKEFLDAVDTLPTNERPTP